MSPLVLPQHISMHWYLHFSRDEHSYLSLCDHFVDWVNMSNVLEAIAKEVKSYLSESMLFSVLFCSVGLTRSLQIWHHDFEDVNNLPSYRKQLSFQVSLQTWIQIITEVKKCSAFEVGFFFHLYRGALPDVQTEA